MGSENKGGRNARSPAEHRAMGTYQPCRHDGFETPEPPKGRPVPPKPLTGEARGEWDRMVARMELSKTSSPVDDAALYQYAQLFAEGEAIRTDHVAIRKLSNTLKRTIRSLNGTDLVEAVKQVVSLQFILAKQTMQLRQNHLAIRMYLVEFGMTPSARTRVKLLKDPGKPSKLMLFKGGKPDEE